MDLHRRQDLKNHWLIFLAVLRSPRIAYILADRLAFARSQVTFSNDFASDILREMNRIFSQKAAYIGELSLTALIDEAIKEARQYHFPTIRETALMGILKYAFGHACTDDPLYPWISRTLKDDKIVDAAARAARLEKKAITWLEHVVARNEQTPT